MTGHNTLGFHTKDMVLVPDNRNLTRTMMDCKMDSSRKTEQDRTKGMMSMMMVNMTDNFARMLKRKKRTISNCNYTIKSNV